MTVKAIYENGVFKPQEPVDLEEHTEVEVVLPPSRSKDSDIPDHWEAAQSIVGLIKNAPADMSENHDFYLYGFPPKR